MESLTKCLICGADRLDPLIAVDGWTIVECRACRLGMLSPRPDEKELADLYDQSYFEARVCGHRGSDDEVARGVRWQRKRVALVRRFVNGKRLLDVGCAVGYFLAAAKRAGFEAEGVEWSDWAAQETRMRFSISVTTGDIFSITGGTQHFDAITLWHMLEHARDPRAVLLAARELLTEGGKVFVELPNYRSVDARCDKNEWVGWQLPYHLWHFSPESLSTLLTTCGFNVLLVKRHPSTYVRNKLRTMPVVSVLRNLVCLFYSGRDMTIVAGKS